MTASIPQSADTSDEESNHYLVIIDTRERRRRRVFCPTDLCPNLGCVLSSDGRRLAAITGKDEVIVWSALATEGLIPDYHLLTTTDRAHDEEYIQELIQSHGPALYNLPGRTGLPLLMEAVANLNFKLFDALVEGPLGLKSRRTNSDDEELKVGTFQMFLLHSKYLSCCIYYPLEGIIDM